MNKQIIVYPLLITILSTLLLLTFLQFVAADDDSPIPPAIPHVASSPVLAQASLAAQPAQASFYGMNTYFTGFERILNDGDDGIPTLMTLGRNAGVQWGREEISWANLQQHGAYWDRNNRKVYDQRIREMAESGYGIIGMIATTPEWARINDCQTRTERYKSYGIIAQDYWCPPQDPQDFANFVQAVVERYDGDGVEDAEGSPRVATWQIWNEPNHWETWPGSAAEYGELLKAGYAAVKAADPTALVVTAGLYVLDGQSGSDERGCTCHQDGLYFFEKVLNAVPDAWTRFDVLAVHPYMPYDAPDNPNILSKVTLWGRLATSSEWLIAQTQQRGGALRPYWISEIGWVTCEDGATSLAQTNAALARYAIPAKYRIDRDKQSASLSADALCKTELEQSDYLLRAHAIALAFGVQHVNYHQLEDKFDVHQRDIWQATAILKTKAQGYAPKIAYTSYNVLTQQLTNTVYLGNGPLHTYTYNPNDQQNPSSRYDLRFQPADYMLVDMIWQTSGASDVSMQVEPGVTSVQLVNFNGVSTPLTVQQGAVQFTVGMQPLYIRQTLPKPTPTPTMTPSPTMPPSPTPTTMATATPTATPTPPPGDAYESDNTCSNAHTLSVNGQAEKRTFHVPSESDWVQIEVVSGTTYLIETYLPAGSPANVDMQRYSECGGNVLEEQDQAAIPHMQLRYTAKNDDPLVLRLFNHDSTVAGTDVTYELVARTLPDTVASDGVLLVLGYLGETSGEHKQSRILTNTIQEVQQLVQTAGYTQVYELLPDLYESPPTLDDVEQAVTVWAKEAIADGGTLTIYIVGQSGSNSQAPAIMLNKPTGETITPDLLSTWLDSLESRTAPITLNVVLDAPMAGGFLGTLTKPGRIVVASAAAEATAWAVDDRSLFTHYFVTALRRGSSLAAAYQQAQQAVTLASPWQQPTLKQSTGSYAAALRGLYATTSASNGGWSPVIASVVAPITATVSSDLAIQATIQDDESVAQAWGIVLPPDYTPPSPTGAFATHASLPNVTLTNQSSQSTRYETVATDILTRTGTYHILLFARDNDDLLSVPAVVEVSVEEQATTFPDGVVYLPIVLRNE